MQSQQHNVQIINTKAQLSQEEKDKLSEIFTKKLDNSEFDILLSWLMKLPTEQFNELSTIIFELAEANKFPLNKSKAKVGGLAIGNWFGWNLKKLNLFVRMRFLKTGSKKIVVEGDSWYEHFFITDIIDWLIKDSYFRIKTIAYGGDWLANYIHDQKYLKLLLEEKPDAFLISGGGNDLVGKTEENGVGRIMQLVHNGKTINPNLTYDDKNRITNIQAQNHGYSYQLCEKIVIGEKFLNDQFYILMNVFKFQYAYILHSIKNEKTLENLKVISHGYDFAIPNNDINRAIRKFGHGEWLYNPLEAANIADEYKHAVVCAMLFKFNTMLQSFTSTFDNFYFIDCLNLAKPNEWNDELHLYSSVFRKIANAFQICINTPNFKHYYKV